MSLMPGAQVEHAEYGFGTVRRMVGNMAEVLFSGESIVVDANELVVKAAYRPKTGISPAPPDARRTSFRRAFEAINLGVVPPETDELIEMTIGGDKISAEVNSWLASSDSEGLCKVVFGNYGTGKSHFLQLARAIALQAGWVVSYLEFDPKAADPAKPHLVYRSLMSGLQFPQKADGSQVTGYMGLIREIRRHWLDIKDLPQVKRSPWFSSALNSLVTEPHSETDQEYVDACGWLFGQNSALQTIRRIARYSGRSGIQVPSMPRTRETAEIYVYHLVVVSEICRELGYKGLLIIMDEAEHVRSYNVRRRNRANNFFDILARCAHRPLSSGEAPSRNEHHIDLPRFWQDGPWFGLFVGLTEGNTFSDPSLSLREACVFLQEERDVILLRTPSPEDYEQLCSKLLSRFQHFYPESMGLISGEESRQKVGTTLRSQFEYMRKSDKPLRTWVKLACLAPSILLAGNASTVEELTQKIKKAVQEATDHVLPWEL